MRRRNVALFLASIDEMNFLSQVGEAGRFVGVCQVVRGVHAGYQELYERRRDCDCG